MRTARTAATGAAAAGERPRAAGKFLWRGGEKLRLTGVTYGTFAPDREGEPYPPRRRVRADFAAMRANGINTVRTYTAPPPWLLDEAAAHDLMVLGGLPWEHHVAFLDEPGRPRAIIGAARSAVAGVAGHPALLGLAIGNEIPGEIVRWHGRRPVERFLQRLYRAVKAEDPGLPLTYANYPTTEYLELPFVDFVSFNVYLESRERLEAYLARLQSLAGDRPLVLAEVGLDSRRNGREAQAATLAWQIDAIFAAGCAGCFVYAWTDEWYRGGAPVDDWDFGLTNRRRRPKPALAAVREAYARPPFPPDLGWPRITVAICTHDGARTLADALDGATALDYPDFEVVVVDDGSTDATPDIAARYDVRLIRTGNRGLSAARNAAWQAATGSIVAYTDDDARPDRHWLRFLAHSFMTGDAAAVGGPNVAPAGDGWVADCVAQAPGGPMHVLLDDTTAEHIPGCNMAVRRDVLQELGGFDPVFRAAGDDVDLCWRLSERGYRIAFSPAALVWHHRRSDVRAYWRQQRGYGKAEALLAAKWPQKYNALGQLTWGGRIYGAGQVQALTLLPERVYHGRWGAAPFQSLYGARAGPLAFATMPEWHLLTLLLAGTAAIGALWRPLLWLLPVLALALALPLAQALMGARRARFAASAANRFAAARRRVLTFVLHLLQPLARLHGRLRHGLTPWRRLPPTAGNPYRRDVTLWSEARREPAAWRQAVADALATLGAAARPGGDYDPWDFEVGGGLFGAARLHLAVEEHGRGRQLVRARTRPVSGPLALPAMALPALLGVLACLSGAYVAGAALAALAAVAFNAMVADRTGACALVDAALQKLGASEALAERRDVALGEESASPPEPELRRAVATASRRGRTPGAERSYRDVTLYLRLWRECRPFGWQLLAILLLGLLATPLTLLNPIPLKIVVDSALADKPLPAVVAWMLPGSLVGKVGGMVLFAGALLIVVSALAQAQKLASTWLSTYTGEKLVLAFRTRLFAHVQRLSFAFHDTRGTHDPSYRIQYDTNALRYVAVDGILPLVSSAITLLSMFYVIYRIDPDLALVALAVSPLLGGLVQLSRRRLRRGYKHVKRLESSALGVVQEVLTSLRVVKAFGQEPREEARFHDLANEGVSARLRVQLLEGGLGFLLGLVTAAGTAAVLAIGVSHVQAQRLTLGELLVVLGYLSQLYAPLNTVSRKVAGFQGYLASAERAFGLLDERPDVEERPDARPLQRAAGAVAFEGVTFSYDGERRALEEVSFRVPAGARVGIAGRTGAGKSTLLSLLTRFYDPQRGRVLLDGVDVRDIRLRDLRDQFAIVLQEPVLFSTSIGENIRYARADASMDEVIAAARAAGIHGFIAGLPEGYDTEVGERGLSLSGGERQRIALARAFLRDAPVLILDEPTSSVDMQTEAEIMQAMERLMNGRTTFLIAHRLPTLGRCDTLFLMEDGKLVPAPPETVASIEDAASPRAGIETVYGR